LRGGTTKQSRNRRDCRVARSSLLAMTKIMMSQDIKLTKIFIKDLTLDCKIGVTEIERREKQPVLINIILWANVKLAEKTDDIEQTVNYEDVYLQIIKFAGKNSFHLLERLAEEIAKICLTKQVVEKVEVRVEKPKALKLAASAGVEIIRTKK